MSQAKKDDKVKVHYTGRLEDGTVFDSSIERDEPLEFILGSGQMIPGFDKGITGMELEEEKTITIPAAEAYGEYDPARIIVIEKTQLPEGLEPQTGQKLQMQHPSGQILTVSIKEIGEDTLKLDANHELAGKDLIFDLKLMAIN
jgi:FKBP-type peptidyl-prolyl cis-trans isomerase 2